MTPMLAVTLVVLAGLTLLGLRLLMLWQRTGGTPELLLSLFFLLAGPVGYVPMVLGNAGLLGDVADPAHVRGMSLFSINAALAVMAHFTRRVFRPAAAWAGALAWGITLALAAVWSFIAWQRGFPLDAPADTAWLVGSVVRMGIFVWSGFEALRYWTIMRRRVAMDLADPVVANRFLLWAVWIDACMMVLVVSMVHVTVGIPEQPRLAASSALGVICVGSVWLTFFPPQAYLRLVRGSAAH